MAAKIMLCKDGKRFAAADPWGEEAMDAIPAGEIVVASITRPRNVKHQRKWGALMSLLFKNQERYPTFEHFHYAMKQAIGHGDYVDSWDGTYKIFVPRSIAFGRLDQKGFEEFYNGFINVVVTKLMPGIEEDALNREVEAYLV